MALIVRTKAGKMVNVASVTPFNLRNQVFPSEPSYGSPQSISGSLDRHPRDHDYQDYSDSNHGIVRQERFYTSTFYDRQCDRSGSSSRSSGPIPGPSYPKYHSRTLDHPVPTPILNVRLVRCTDTMTKVRGRTRNRLSTDKSNPTNGATRVEDEEAVVTTGNPETSCEGLIAAGTFQPLDVGGSVTINWND